MSFIPGSTAIVAVTKTTITLQASQPTGGTMPYSFQWYRSTIYNFIPSSATLLSGQTSPTLNDTNLAENTPYYYVLIATDSTTPTALAAVYPQTGVITNNPWVCGNWIAPQIPDFQQRWIDDFPFGPDPKTQFPDYRILNSMQMLGLAFFNPSFFPDQATFSLGYLLLSAHYMVMNIRASSQGMKGQFGFLQNSKSAGISVGIEIPQRIKDNPDFAWLCQTNYGSTYLHLILPQLTGQMWASPTFTNP